MAPTPVFPHLAAKILNLQTELDAIWPGWRKKQRFDHLGEGGDQAGYDLKARIKWCLKRLSLLEEGKDWDVMIARDLRNRSQCYAHPVIPATGDAGAEPDRNPASPMDIRRVLDAIGATDHGIEPIGSIDLPAAE